MNAFLRLPLPVATGILAVATVAGIAGLVELRLGVWSLLALVPVLGVAGWYLWAYAQRPLVERPPGRRPAPLSPTVGPGTPGEAATTEAGAPAAEPVPPAETIDPDEPFDDPVEEADRLGVPPAEPAPADLPR